MSVPFFYIADYEAAREQIELDEDTSRHIVQVLRMKKSEALHLTDGQGHLIRAEITDAHKKHCEVKIQTTEWAARPVRHITLCISLLKNSTRFEWLLEKLTEIGIQEIIPLVCHRTEKQKFREDRMKNILVSAMLQSQQCWLPMLHAPTAFNQLFSDRGIGHSSQKFIAHCISDGWQRRNLADLVNESLPSQAILIGPEGDFTAEEVQLATDNHFDGVSLGDSRLRAETAGMVAATILKLL